MAKMNMESLLRLCAQPLIASTESLSAAQNKSLFDTVHELVRHVTSPNTLVREQVSSLLLCSIGWCLLIKTHPSVRYHKWVGLLGQVLVASDFVSSESVACINVIIIFYLTRRTCLVWLCVVVDLIMRCCWLQATAQCCQLPERHLADGCV